MAQKIIVTNTFSTWLQTGKPASIPDIVLLGITAAWLIQQGILITTSLLFKKLKTISAIKIILIQKQE